jgi:hypothetical protein
VETCVPFSSASPSFGPSVTARNPARASASRAGSTTPSTPRFALADQYARKMRERREIARRADRPLRRDARNDSGVRERDERFDHAPANPGVAARERGDLERNGETHDGIVDERPGACRVREHERALQLRKPRIVDPRTREQTETRVDAIDRFADATRWSTVRAAASTAAFAAESTAIGVGSDQSARSCAERQISRCELEWLHCLWVSPASALCRTGAHHARESAPRPFIIARCRSPRAPPLRRTRRTRR